MAWYREWFGEEYLDLYANRDEEEAKRQVAFFVDQIGAVRGCLLDLACGSGRHINELVSRGYRTIGCDLSYVLLRTGMTDSGALPAAMADMRDLPFCDSSFDGLVNFFTSFGYFSEEGDNLQVVREMSRVLSKGAPFLFDYLNVQREMNRMIDREEKETESGRVLIERWFDPRDRAFNKRITIGPKRFMERVRAYDLDEISMMFAAASFRIYRVFGDFDGSAFDPITSPRLIVVGTKK